MELSGKDEVERDNFISIEIVLLSGGVADEV